MPATLPVSMLIGEQLLLIFMQCDLGVCIICSYTGRRVGAEGKSGFLCLHKALSNEAP